MNLRPKNVTPSEWRKFVKLKTSQAFKSVSDSYKERRRNQIPHTCSRKGMVRLSEEMKSGTENPSEVTRLKVWVKSRTKKMAHQLIRMQLIRLKRQLKWLTMILHRVEQFQEKIQLSQLLGPDNPG